MSANHPQDKVLKVVHEQIALSAAAKRDDSTRLLKLLLKCNADLEQAAEEDPDQFGYYFCSLFYRGLAGDPIVAGTLIRKMLVNPLTAGSVLLEGTAWRSP